MSPRAQLVLVYDAHFVRRWLMMMMITLPANERAETAEQRRITVTAKFISIFNLQNNHISRVENNYISTAHLSSAIAASV